MIQNRIENFFLVLARHYGIEIDHRWKTALHKKIGQKIGIKSANNISTWIVRDRIPEHIIDNFFDLDIPDSLMEKALSCLAGKAVGNFAIDKHRSIGANLKAICHYLIPLSVELQNRYQGKAASISKTITDDILKLRSVLDDIVISENPKLTDDEVLTVYYGKIKPEDQVDLNSQYNKDIVKNLPDLSKLPNPECQFVENFSELPQDWKQFGKDFIAVPLVAHEVAAGQPIISRNYIEGWSVIHMSRLKGKKNLVAIRVNGRSMEPTIRDGSIVCIDRDQREVIDGKLYAVAWDDGAVIKRVYKDGKSLQLVSDNLAREFRKPISISLKKLDYNPVIGKVVWAWVDFENDVTVPRRRQTDF